MRVIIAGSRGITSYAEVVHACAQAAAAGIVPTVVVCGMARGVDLLGKRWADERGIPLEPHPVTAADWRRYGRSAGHRRNADMAAVADALIAIFDGKSAGTAGMIALMRRQAKPVFVHQPGDRTLF